MSDLVEGLGGRYVSAEVTGPLGEKTNARYGILRDGQTAVLEMAEAAGITLVDRSMSLDLNLVEVLVRPRQPVKLTRCFLA